MGLSLGGLAEVSWGTKSKNSEESTMSVSRYLVLGLAGLVWLLTRDRGETMVYQAPELDSANGKES